MLTVVVTGNGICTLFEGTVVIPTVGGKFDVVLASRSIKRMLWFHLLKGTVGVRK